MSVVVEVENPITEKIKDITGETSDLEAIRIALERFVRDYEIKPESNGSSEEHSSDLPDEYWNELFSQPQLPIGTLDRIIREEREDRF
jgi:3'-phosphoadenosine 5'-phosphosulfate sulfotransferase